MNLHLLVVLLLAILIGIGIVLLILFEAKAKMQHSKRNANAKAAAPLLGETNPIQKMGFHVVSPSPSDNQNTRLKKLVEHLQKRANFVRAICTPAKAGKNNLYTFL